MEGRANILREMKICRFCLDEEGPLTNIYVKDSNKYSVPLPLQIMACLAIEVFANDGMPQLICKNCRTQTIQAYNFKTTCKKSDDALKLFLATGHLARPATNEMIIANEEDEENDNKSSKKRPNQQDPPENVDSKRIKNEVEVVMLNYSSSLDISKNIICNDEVDVTVEQDDEEQNIVLHMEEDGDSQETVVSQDDDGIDDQEEYLDEDDEDDKINPVLKVSQVETDIFPCPHCERSFPLQQLLDLHKANHERERSFGCDECGRKFFTKYDLGKHIQTHSSSKPFSCVVCKKHFSRESLLHRHEKIHVDVPKYLCTHCGRTFLTREDLDSHSEKHKKKRPFTCRVCKKSFVFKQGLERHETSHAHEKPHKCNYCEASFTSPIKLTRHITSHAGLRPYPCKMCGRTFLLSHHLTRHMRSHYATKSSGVSPVGQHKCDVCSMSFRRKDSLINHSAIHSMVNLKCVICNTAFDSAQMVKEHITTHLSGLPFPCDKCDYSFETADQLEEHELKHAEMEYEEQIEREVTEEALQQAEQDDLEEYSPEGVAEFTITNDGETPEVIRRSKREPKIKNFADFLKYELNSDTEDGKVETEDEEPPPPKVFTSKVSVSEDTIKPIVRTEGTKVYTRKNSVERQKPRIINASVAKTAPLEQITQSQESAIHNLVSAPGKQYVDMKIGDKTVRVQKLMMTKAEIEAMAKAGKLEMKGNTFLIRKQALRSSKQTIKPADDGGDGEPSTTSEKFVVKKTYRRQTEKISDETSQDTNSSVLDLEDDSNDK